MMRFLSTDVFTPAVFALIQCGYCLINIKKIDELKKVCVWLLKSATDTSDWSRCTNS